MTATNYIALIPAYEPDNRLLEVISDLDRSGFEVIVVDDGSGDGYSDLFWQAEQTATVLTHDRNRGKGAALRTGLEYISKYKLSGLSTVVVTVDADGQHLAADAMKIARTAARKPGTLVLGGRAFSGEVPLRSSFGNTVTRHIFRFVTGTSVFDTQTGLRAFGAEMIPELLSISGDRYEYEINVLMECARHGTPIIEEEIETIYHDNNQKSHFNAVKDSFRVYREILRFSASSFASFIVDYGMYALLLAVMGWLANSSSATAVGIALAYGLVISNVGARLVSSVFNYIVNRRLVFRSKASVGKSAMQYFLLAALVLAGNTVVLQILVDTLGINSLIAKVLTEIMFFFISWTVQRYVIFYQSAEDQPNALGEPAGEFAGMEEARSMRFRAVHAPRLRDNMRTIRENSNE